MKNLIVKGYLVKVFISYSRLDADFVERLKSDLLVQGIEVWIDHERLKPGTPNWERSIRESIRLSQALVLAASPHSSESPYVVDELEIAKANQVPIYPIWISGDKWINSIPMGWGRTQYSDARGSRYKEGVLSLINALSISTVTSVLPPDNLDLVPNSLRSLGYVGRRFNQGETIIPPLCMAPAGVATLGTDEDEDLGYPQRRTYLGVFHISKYPVTVAEYACAVRAQAIPEPETYAGRMAIRWQDQLSRPDYPVVNIFWNQAQAYVDWLAKITDQPWRLPSEDEWEKAARGTDGRIYPWGNSWDPSRANTSINSDDSSWDAYSGKGGGVGDITRVGSYPSGASPYGVEDMAGNVWEWTSSLADERDSEKWRVLRGGSWAFGYGAAKTFCRLSGALPHPLLDAGMGFRLAIG